MQDNTDTSLYALQIELKGSGILLGYRQMWKRIVQKYKLSVSRLVLVVTSIQCSYTCQNIFREVVRVLLQLMAPEETNMRKAHRLKRREYYTKVRFDAFAFSKSDINGILHTGSKSCMAHRWL